MIERALLEQFSTWSQAGEAMVLATVVGTDGSTYRKSGARMLIRADGRFAGLLSGGCLEGDLVTHAGEALAAGEARLVRYDMRDARHDELWGLGLGCNGLIEILLQPLVAAEAYRPFAEMAQRFLAGHRLVQLLVVASTDASTRPGASLLLDGEEQLVDGLPPGRIDALLQASREGLSGGARAGRITVGELDLVVLRLRPPPCLVLLGGGADADPVLRIASELGWETRVADHRPAYVARLHTAGFSQAHELTAGAPLPAALLEAADAVVIMSHHLQTDLHYLREVAESPVPYVGLLGPAARRDRLLERLGAEAARLGGRLHAPVGLRLGGEGPAAIALSILAELQGVLHRSPDHEPPA
ncbi:MAG: XdhC/CoxI family protein [Gammaproteobacteria bacterium]|nr:MAG: XdhC/CoxI family protein [Gammaproteobacteria bacterium]